ncbi:serine/threonine-protein kinase [Desulfobaculum xiamenense]|uniref:Serine/threonine-protein kinase n=1 Tax=Desulfobaculum xiamenense TaxID=995050 RepID=A0A846QSD5_9BACT|nr:DUF1566 domain-containing protein [Desulfobaculum xiamenense]NJB69283.1 serine/threonine-protein kinase [Desulfobaculum xiamenense]
MRSIAQYEILGLLGRGGMGAVYKVRKADGPIVALKILAPTELLEAVAGRDELERRFLAEAEAMADIRHHNVATVLDTGRDAAGRPFFTMEYCCDNVGALIGETYRVEAPSRVLRLDRATDIAAQALNALACLHDSGIVHRDMKPFNLLLAPDGTVKLIDFGLSRLRGERMRLHGSERVGSPYYAAPEQEAAPDAADARADLYAVGVMLFRMLTGHLPEVANQPASHFNPELDATWDAFLRQSLARDREERFPTARAMRDALAALVAAWRERIDATCALPNISPDIAPDVEHLVETWTAPLRATPLRTGTVDADAAFDVDDLGRPIAFCANDFQDRGDTVYDATTGLVWQTGCSAQAMDWTEAEAYARALGSARFAGYDGWRLPTAPELLSLVTPVRKGRDFCVESLFSTACKRLWTADHRTHTAAWYADMELGFLWRHDLTCRNWVRAVCSTQTVPRR